MNFDAIKAAAEGYKDDMSKFLRAMIAIPSAIFIETFMAYIGLGLAPPELSVGTLLSFAVAPALA